MTRLYCIFCSLLNCVVNYIVNDPEFYKRQHPANSRADVERYRPTIIICLLCQIPIPKLGVANFLLVNGASFRISPSHNTCITVTKILLS